MVLRLLVLGCLVGAVLPVRGEDQASVVRGGDQAGEQARPARPGTPIEIRFHAVQLDLARLRKLGVRWEIPQEPLEEAQAQEFYRLVGGVLSGGPYAEIRNVQLSARAGQPVTIQTAKMKVHAAPKFLENGDLEVRLAIDHLQLDGSDRRLHLDRTFVVQPGNVAYLGQSPPGVEEIADGQPRGADREEPKVVTLLFAAASTLERVAPPLHTNQPLPGLYQPLAPTATSSTAVAPTPHPAAVYYPAPPSPIAPTAAPRVPPPPAQAPAPPALPPRLPARS